MIAGPSEVHVRQDSTLSLTCSLHGPQEVNSTLEWYHNEQRIDLEQVRGAISLASERREHFIKSRLLIPRAAVHDGGNYSCVPTQALPVSVLVHVLNGRPIHPTLTYLSVIDRMMMMMMILEFQSSFRLSEHFQSTFRAVSDQILSNFRVSAQF